MDIVFYTIEGFLFFIILVCGVLSLSGVFSFFKGANKSTRFEKSGTYARFAVIIPARDESKVIEGNLRSVSSADYPEDKRDIYVIVESEADKTVEIAAKYKNAHTYVRKDLSGVGKGYALDECLRHIFESGEEYDGFLILDADNVIDKSFLAKMNDAFQAGVDLACGKRDNKDWNVSAVSAASGMTFTAVNALMNKPKTYIGKTILISGTGFFVRAEKLKKLGGWPFHSLTEDYEITTFADCESWKTAYVEEAVYYDEQPIGLRQSIVQRSRWVKGFFSVRKKYAKMKKQAKAAARKKKDKRQKFTFKSGMPIICLCITLVLYLACLILFLALALILQNVDARIFLRRILGLFLGAYLLLAVLTVYLLVTERRSMDITPAMRVKVTLFHPVFLFTYVIAAIRAIFMKNTWERIDHVINRELP